MQTQGDHLMWVTGKALNIGRWLWTGTYNGIEDLKGSTLGFWNCLDATSLWRRGLDMGWFSLTTRNLETPAASALLTAEGTFLKSA